MERLTHAIEGAVRPLMLGRTGTVRCCAFCLALIWLASAAVGAPASLWGRVDPTYALSSGGFVATDGGTSQGDRYLLSREPMRAFVLSWEVARRHPVPDQDRAIVCWSVAPADTANRCAFFFSDLIAGVGRWHRFRLVVMGGQASLFVDGKPAGRGPVLYGAPPEAGHVGFLHYYRYDYAYRNVRLQSLDAEKLPPPTGLRATGTRDGLIALQWAESPDLAGVLRYTVERDVSRTFPHPTPLGMCSAPHFEDRTARAGQHYWYRVRAQAPGQPQGPASAPVEAAVGKGVRPLPPAFVRAVRRIDGSVWLAWALHPRGRAAWVGIRRRGSVARLASGQTRYLDPAPGADSYEILVGDPDGGPPARKTVRPVPLAPPVSPTARFPTVFPRLVVTPAEVARIRASAASGGAARGFLQALQRRAEAIAARPVALPAPGDTRHWSLASDLREVALAALLLKRDDLADHGRQILSAYAANYPRWTWNNRRGRTFHQSSLFEAMWSVSIIEACDLLLGTGRVTADERRRLERELLPLIVANFRVDDFRDDPRIADLHYRCYNFQAWHLAVTGLAGLLLGDADLVQWTLESPYGYRHLLAHDIRDDGLFWERSLGYHQFVISALMHLTEAAWRCNLNLYAIQAADRIFRDEDCNYEVDGDHGPKSFALMFEAPFFFIFPDRSFANVADSGRGPLTASSEWRVAAVRIADPKLRWLASADGAPEAPRWRGRADISGRVALSYDEDALYVRAWVSDDVVRNPHQKPADAWAGDLVWLALRTQPGPAPAYDFIYGLIPGVPGREPPLLVQFNRPGSTEAQLSAGRIAVAPWPGPPPGYYLEAAIPLAEVGLRPEAGLAVPGEICLYDGDRAEGPAAKEKMVGWCSRVDRYDPAEGGRFVFSSGPGATGRLPVPRQSVAVDGQPDGPIPPGAATLTGPDHVMTDAPAVPDLGVLLASLSRQRPQPPSPARAPETARFCRNGRFAWGASLFPSSGFAILRDHAGLPWRQPRDTLAVNLNYGPYGGGHGHPDRLSIVLYALGRQWIPDFGSCDYESPLKGEWTSQTVSHNTVVVDGISQYPTGDRNVTWPSDTPDHKAMGRLRFFHADPALRAAGAWCDTVHPGVHLERAVLVAGGYCVDVYRVESADTHTYDYVLHVDGEPSDLPGLSASGEPLGGRCGYQHLGGLSRGVVEGAWEGAWQAREGSLRVRLLPSGPTEIAAGRSITTRLEETMPFVLLRRRARRTTFATLLVPVAPAAARPVLEEVAGEGATAVRVGHAGGRDLVVFSHGGGWRAGGLEGDARAVLLRQGTGGQTLSLAHCTWFRGAGIAVGTRVPANLFLRRPRSGAWSVRNVGTAGVEVSVGGRALVLAPGQAQACADGTATRR